MATLPPDSELPRGILDLLEKSNAETDKLTGITKHPWPDKFDPVKEFASKSKMSDKEWREQYENRFPYEDIPERMTATEAQFKMQAAEYEKRFRNHPAWPDGPPTPYDDTADAMSAAMPHMMNKVWDEDTRKWKYVKTEQTAGPAWNPQKSQAYEQNMANKFLPFIVETSTPLHIFKTLLSRSKGMNNNLVASVFNMILMVELSVLRGLVKDMPDMSLEQLYEELLIKFPECRIPEEQVNLFQNIQSWFPGKGDLWVDDLNQFEMKDIMIFFLSVSVSGQDLTAYTNAPLDCLVKTDPDRKAQVFSGLGNYVHFDDSGEKVYFKDESDLSSFVLYHALIAGIMEPDAPERTFNACFKNGAEL